MSRTSPPREIARLEGVERVHGGFRGALFAELDDGRVLARGVAVERSWYSGFGPRSDDWVELEELRGGEVALGSYHGCARFEDGRVLCFGDPENWGGDRHARNTIVEVPELRGSTRLVMGQRRVCGWTRGERLRCLGPEASGNVGSEPGRDGVAELDVRRALRRARELPPRR